MDYNNTSRSSQLNYNIGKVTDIISLVGIYDHIFSAIQSDFYVCLTEGISQAFKLPKSI